MTEMRDVIGSVVEESVIIKGRDPSTSLGMTVVKVINDIKVVKDICKLAFLKAQVTALRQTCE